MLLKWLKNMLNDFFKETALAKIEEKNVLISGYKGYVGKALLQDCFVTPVDSAPSKKVDVFVHLGACVNSSQNDFEKNIQTDAAVIRFCVNHKIRLLYASSNNVYPFEKNCDEEKTPYFASDYYALSKVTGENLCRLFSDLDYIALRFGDVFGKDQRHGNLFHALQKKISVRLPLPLYGKGLKIRNYIYIKELVRILKFFVCNKNLSRKSFNVCFDTPFSVAEIVSFLSQKTLLPIENTPFDDKPDIRTMKNNRLIETGYSFLYTMETALEDYIYEIG